MPMVKELVSESLSAEGASGSAGLANSGTATGSPESFDFALQPVFDGSLGSNDWHGLLCT